MKYLKSIFLLLNNNKQVILFFLIFSIENNNTENKISDTSENNLILNPKTENSSAVSDQISSDNQIGFNIREARKSLYEIISSNNPNKKSIINNDLYPKRESLPYTQNPNRRSSDNKHIYKKSKENLLNSTTTGASNVNSTKEKRSNSNTLLSPMQNSNSLAPGHYHPARRESFLYKADNDNEYNIKLQMRSASIVSSSEQ